MQQIVPPIVLANKILGKQKADTEASYRLSTHCVRIEQPEGVLLHSTLTGELLLLTHVEAELLGELPGPVPSALEELIPRWFLRPEGTDEIALVEHMRNIAWYLWRKDASLTNYLIFTTTACNARCCYCFEAGIRRATMSEETARAVGAYIATHSGGNPVRLVWFGGEPMLNVRAIDAICGEVRRHGIEFSSRMDSNGYLFDAKLAAHARTDWEMDFVQITLDGTEEIYNQRKAYVHPEGSPFQRVLRNIGLLLDAGIQVDIRMNMNEENEADLYALVDELAERFAERQGFGIHCRVLIENKGVKPSAYTDEQRHLLAEKVEAMWMHLLKKGVALKAPLRRKLALHSCWSDNVNAATITPDGHLGRCESHIDQGLWGSVFSEERDEDVLRQWRERRPAEEVCRTCALYPRCIRLKKCVTRTERCSPIEREELWIRLQQCILGTYEDWKAGKAEKR